MLEDSRYHHVCSVQMDDVAPLAPSCLQPTRKARLKATEAICRTTYSKRSADTHGTIPGRGAGSPSRQNWFIKQNRMSRISEHHTYLV